MFVVTVIITLNNLATVLQAAGQIDLLINTLIISKFIGLYQITLRIFPALPQLYLESMTFLISLILPR